MPKLRKFIFNVHLWIGLILGLYFSFLGLTGSILVFKVELARLFRPDLYHVKSTANWERIPYDILAKHFRETHPQAPQFGLRLPVDATDTVVFGYLPSDPPDWRGPPSNPYSFGKLTRGQGRHDFHEVFVDPYTGKVLGDRVIFGPFFYTLHNLHAKLLFEDAGNAVHRVGVLLLLALELTGIWLWFPRTKNFLQQLKLRTTVKWSASFKRIVFDLHNAIGVFSFVILLPIVITATSFVWPRAADSVIHTIVRISETSKQAISVRGPSPNIRTSPCADLPSIDRALRGVPLTVRDLQPLAVDVGVSEILVNMGNPESRDVDPVRATVTIDPCSYVAKEIDRASDEPVPKRLSSSLLFIHNGQWASGVAYYLIKALWSLTGLCPLILTGTGVFMYLNKRKAHRPKHKVSHA